MAGGASDWDFTTLQYDPAGQLLWERTLDGPFGEGDRPAGIAVDAGGNAYVAGHGRAAAPCDSDVVLIRYDPDGGDLLVAGNTRPAGASFEDDWAVVAYALGLLFADGFESGDTSSRSLVVSP